MFVCLEVHYIWRVISE